ncbi:hypothetical protein [Haloimpatiens massiliensis]|uniref:hypothetical protein n=1 Tax=Haloimpatiens massiliensis TaxID=1658110 RepID=UPI000C846442|nr:hypothetical protein [Haloimpatiens massiliensis]
MSKELFEKINVFKTYRGDSTFKKPYKINKFELKIISKKTVFTKTYFNITYSVSINDANNKEVGGSWDVSVKYIVKKVNNTWYIIDKEEDA